MLVSLALSLILLCHRTGKVDGHSSDMLALLHFKKTIAAAGDPNGALKSWNKLEHPVLPVGRRLLHPEPPRACDSAGP